MWEQSHFARNLDFAEFSQTLLPYRNDKEPVGRYYTSDFHNIFKDVLNSEKVTEIEEIVRRFNLYIHFLNLFKKNEVNFGYAGLYDVLQWESLKCERRCYWSAKVLSSCGIPTMIDFTPSFSNKVRGKHYWITVRDTSGKYLPFNPLWQLLNDSSYFRHTSKVYRLTFQANNKSPYFLIGKDFRICPRQSE